MKGTINNRYLNRSSLIFNLTKKHMKKITKLFLLAGTILLMAPQGVDAQSFKGNGLMGSYYRCKSSTLKAWQALGKMDQINVNVFDSTMVGTMITPSGKTFEYNFDDAVTAFRPFFLNKSDDWFSARFEGFIRAPKSGDYILSGKGDNGFRVYINDVLVLDHWIGDWDNKVSGTAIKLAGGSYNKIKIEFAEYVGGQNLNLFWKVPGAAEVAIPKEDLFTQIPLANALNGSYFKMSQPNIDSLKANQPHDKNVATEYLGERLDLFNGQYIGNLPTSKCTGTDFQVDFGKVFDVNLTSLGGDYFSAKYDGFIKSPKAGDVTFTFWGDNGYRLWVNDSLVINHWARDWEKDIVGKPFTMKADTTYKVHMEFFEEGGGQALRLSWAYEGQAKTYVPVTAFSTNDINMTRVLPGPYDGMIGLPGTITAANFNKGGEGEGYSDKTATNDGDAAFRITEGVDIKLVKTEKVVDAVAEEWLSYTVKANFVGAYKPTINYAASVASKLAILVDGVSVDSIALPVNGLLVGDSTLKKTDKIYFTEGEHIVKFVLVSGSAKLKSFVFDRTNSPYMGVMATIPGKVESELYDLGGQDVAYWDNNMGHNDGNNPRFRADEGVDIGATFADGNRNTPALKTIGWNDGNEWQLYTVDVKETNDYSVLFCYSSGANKNDAKVTFYLDGVLLVDQLPVPSSNNWDIYKKTKASYKVNMTKGVHVLKALCNTGGFDFEGVTFAVPVEQVTAPDAAITTHGGKSTLTATVTPANASIKALLWKIDGEALGATIDANTGIITSSGTGAGNGTVKIVATAADEFGATDTLNVVITNQMTLVDSVKIDPATITEDGGNVTPALIILPEAANNKTVTWSIVGTDLGATIDAATGKVTANGLTTGNGVLIVKATANDLSGLSDTTTVTISGQVGEITATELVGITGVSVYPNPVVKVLNITGVAVGTKVEIYNIAGILVKSIGLTDGTINVSDLSNGLYIVKINGQAIRIVKK